MKYMDLVSIVNGQYKEKMDAQGKYQLAATEDIRQFKDMLQIDNVYIDGFRKTESSTEFYEAYELFFSAFDNQIQEDVFYGAKLGYLLEGVPCKLTFLIKKAVSANPTPSLAVQSISALAWGRFLKEGTIAKGITIKDVLDAVYGRETNLIDQLQLRVRHSDFSEVYVQNVDRICLLPNGIADNFSLEDLQEIVYVPKKGVCIAGAPLRTWGEYRGITLNEFDLRDVE